MTTLIALLIAAIGLGAVAWAIWKDDGTGVSPAEQRRQAEARARQARKDAVVADYHRRRREA